MSGRSKPSSSPPGWWGPMVARDELVWFILANALDVFMTYWMLQHGGFRESNPVAEFFLYRWGHRGLIYFKFGIVAFVCVIAHIVGQRQPALASRMLKIGTLIVFGVVVYSFLLYSRGAPAPQLPEEFLLPE